jgi:hypothetical protein
LPLAPSGKSLESFFTFFCKSFCVIGNIFDLS